MNRRFLLQLVLSGLLALRIRPSTLFTSLRLRSDDFVPVWTRYVNDPSDRNARAVVDMLPEYCTGKGVATGKVCELIERGLHVLEARVMDGHQVSAHIAVRLLTVTDGATSEWLDMIIGQYIHVDAEQFLRLMARYSHFPSFRKMYCNLGDNLVDDFAGQRLETCRRVQALQNVHAPDLQATRAMVVRDLSRRA